ncbi:hypothetical protein V5799_013145 [Amblyomma americanum]|uniref:Uncharacterized protein n=1 Tax=Amblyomma americanum TaxID=6943 RepID=A0AAQ4E6T1_AMBAM
MMKRAVTLTRGPHSKLFNVPLRASNPHRDQHQTHSVVYAACTLHCMQGYICISAFARYATALCALCARAVHNVK